MEGPHVAANAIFYEFEEFQCFKETNKFMSSRFKEWEKRICTITIDNALLELNNDPDEKQIESLIEISNQSLVGKGKETILDEKIRKSREIKSDIITLDPKFIKLVNREASKLRKSIGIITKIDIVLHKITIYEKNSFFDTHLDSEHKKDQVATLSIELSTDYSEGQMEINGEIVDKPNKEELQFTMFFTDTPHKINKIGSGHRISMQFDIIQTERLTRTVVGFKRFIKTGIVKLKEKKVTKLGIPLNHIYFVDDVTTVKNISLKGRDKLAYDTLLEHADKIEICGIIIQNEMICREEILNILKLSSAFKALYDKCENEYEKNSNKSEQVKYNSYDEIILKYRDDSKFIAIKDEYLLGNVVFLNTNYKCKYLYEGISCDDDCNEVTLGNEGFYGKIRNNLAMIVTLK